MRFVLDCDAYVVLVKASEAKAAAIRRADAAEIEFLMTHLQWDDIACLRNRALRMSICEIPRRNVPTHHVIREASRGGAVGGVDHVVDHVPSATERSWDATFLISVAAQYDGTVFVTDDTEMSGRGMNENIEVWTTERLLAFLLSSSFADQQAIAEIDLGERA